MLLQMNKPTSERKEQKIACIGVTEKIPEVSGALERLVQDVWRTQGWP